MKDLVFVISSDSRIYNYHADEKVYLDKKFIAICDKSRIESNETEIFETPEELIQKLNDSKLSWITQLMDIILNRVREPKNYTPQLMFAIQNNYNELTKILLKLNVDLTFQDEHKNTPLHLACENNNLEIIKLLIEAGAPLNVQNIVGNTPLMIDELKTYMDSGHEDIFYWSHTEESLLAVKKKRKEILEVFIQHGADLSVRNISGQNVLDIERSKRYINCDEFLKPYFDE